MGLARARAAYVVFADRLPLSVDRKTLRLLDAVAGGRVEGEGAAVFGLNAEDGLVAALELVAFDFLDDGVVGDGCAHVVRSPG